MIVAGAGFGALLGAPTRYIVTNETPEIARATAVGLLSQALIVGQILGSSIAGGLFGTATNEIAGYRHAYLAFCGRSIRRADPGRESQIATRRTKAADRRGSGGARLARTLFRWRPIAWRISRRLSRTTTSSAPTARSSRRSRVRRRAQPSQEFDSLGELAGASETIALGFDANEHPPELRTHDRFGNRIDEVRFHPAWHGLMQHALRAGLAGAPWRDPRAVSARAPRREVLHLGAS